MRGSGGTSRESARRGTGPIWRFVRVPARGVSGDAPGGTPVPTTAPLRHRYGSMRLPSASQCASTFLLGCTRGGSPGIFG
jgi:hypothetical protein